MCEGVSSKDFILIVCVLEGGFFFRYFLFKYDKVSDVFLVINFGIMDDEMSFYLM